MVEVEGHHSYFSRYGGGAQAHAPARPAWTCVLGCGAWPCAQARADLHASLPARAVSEYMSTILEDVAADLPHLPPDLLFDRFLAWTRADSPDRVNRHAAGGAGTATDAT